MKAAEALPEPEGFPLELEGKLSLADVRLVMLVGLPGTILQLCWRYYGGIMVAAFISQTSMYICRCMRCHC